MNGVFKLKKDILIMGIETSCDETSISIVKNGREVLSNIINSQITTHVEYGGVVPEIASRMHTEVINLVMKQALKEANVKLEDIDGIAVTYGPRISWSTTCWCFICKGFKLCYK